jgi:acyl-CoA synthetase (AMP-forming)/AMP-acid ligase II
LGYVDEDGYVYIVDRKKDIIIRGGENISSMEVEEFLHTHPAILESSAIGAPEPVLGETVMAVVVAKSGRDLSEKELQRFCEEGLERFKVPARVEFVSELPRNPSGKVLKRELKARYFGRRSVTPRTRISAAAALSMGSQFPRRLLPLQRPSNLPLAFFST